MVWQHETVAVPAKSCYGSGAWQITALEVGNGAEIAVERIGRGRAVGKLRPKLKSACL